MLKYLYRNKQIQHSGWREGWRETAMQRIPMVQRMSSEVKRVQVQQLLSLSQAHERHFIQGEMRNLALFRQIKTLKIQYNCNSS